jgi:hypothetical protein
MHLRRSTLSLIAVTMISVGTVLGVAPVLAGAATTPTVQVQPSTNVADGQAVTVTGAGFTPSAFIAVVECQTGATSESNCDISNYQDITASSSGSFSTPFIASRYLQTGTSTVDCAVSGACILVAANYNNQAEAATTPLTFDPNAPTPPALAMGATLSPTGTVAHKTGVATVSGTVKCNRAVIVSVYGQVSQIHQRILTTGFFSTSVLCTSSGTWSAVVTSQGGLLTQGRMSVSSASAFGFVGGTSSQVSLSGIVTLKQSKS